MKQFSLIKPLLVTTLLFSGAIQAAPDARQVLAVSPVDDIVAHYPAMMSQGIREGLIQSEKLSPMMANTIGNLVGSSFSAEEIEQQIITNLQASLTSSQLQAVHDWYETPVAKKITAAEIVASMPSEWEKVRARAAELNRQYKGTLKADMFDRFDRAARATETAVDTTIAVQLGLASSMAAFSSDSANHEELRQRIESQRGALRGIVGQQVFDSYLYTYENIGAQEMDLYLSFLESSAGTAFSNVVTDSIQRAITEPVERIGKQVSGFLSPDSPAAQ
ncbi:DUF2059 domain-containing protein [Marinobacter sp. F3R08]|uniref:DUF2059 domain-containing protein n=1 Tax=Marinobacter sp. F3R08 TaxID=2841559 RepID=UPI001C087C0F|nr:DUF2059 domain-containing protein [Marinobacter sp. F3R08]MBU2953851.1 DUF2059 domain-containing protein [Marinobacter sp. F3R08]